MSDTAATQRFVCLHGHFYQPPRENPWLDLVEREESAHPHHDWNRRITAECYAPNAHARILDARGRIRAIVNNYPCISFNFGPTLLSWLEHGAPQTYAAILAADASGRERYGGRGPAMAQPYNHAILPLCNARDRRTQVLWGIEDFRERFGRDPEGMWLPETAVDRPTVELLAEEGIRFTVLAPGQAESVRCGDGEWRTVEDGQLDTRRAYRVELPSGRPFDVFFYDGSIARQIAFERLLDSGEALAQRILAGFDQGAAPQLVHAATDGETYGHHHAHGEMALAAALQRLERTPGVRLIHYGHFLDQAPAVDQVRLREASSWSCAHGIERWQDDCGCASEIHPGWHQRWRAPLRDALDWLRDALAPRFERDAARYLRDPWLARDGYSAVIRRRGLDAVEAFLHRHATRPLTDAQRSRVLQLLELQRCAMLMYTSCGWFFEELSRLETVQVLRYAARTVELAEALFDEPFEGELVRRLEQAPSNVERFVSGAGVWREQVRGARVNLLRYAAETASRRLVGGAGSPGGGRYRATARSEHRWSGGDGELLGGTLALEAGDTLERCEVEYAVLRQDDALRSWVRPAGAGAARQWLQLLDHLRRREDDGGIARRLDGELRGFAFGDLTPTTRRIVLDSLLRSSLDALVRRYERLGAPRPHGPHGSALRSAATQLIQQRLVATLQPDGFSVEEARRQLERARRDDLALDPLVLAEAVQSLLAALCRRLVDAAGDDEAWRTLDDTVAALLALPLPVDLIGVQNAVFGLLSGTGALGSSRSEPALFRRLGFAV